jgi:glycosyltransferase involved in cell wall biosynthesis
LLVRDLLAYHACLVWALLVVTDGNAVSPKLIVATIFREHGSTGVHTHFWQLLGYLDKCGIPATLLTPFSWARPLTYPAYAPRLVLDRFSGAASVRWYRYWHELFLRRALARCLATAGECVVYAQGPLEAGAALKARRGKHQRVVMAVHFRFSQADEHAEPGRELKRGGNLYRSIRAFERTVIPELDGIVYVSKWARDALLSWLPEAGQVPYEVIGNFITPMQYDEQQELLADLVSTGKLELRKNHRFLIDVLAEAKKTGRLLTLDIYGDGPLRGELEEQARLLGVDSQVRFRGFRTDVRQFLSRYRVYVHAASAETSSLAIMEAMAAGLPIVAANVGPIAELCDDSAEARFWPLDNSTKAAATLLELLDSPDKLNASSMAARLRFSRDFDANVVAPRLCSFLFASDAMPLS